MAKVSESKSGQSTSNLRVKLVKTMKFRRMRKRDLQYMRGSKNFGASLLEASVYSFQFNEGHG